MCQILTLEKKIFLFFIYFLFVWGSIVFSVLTLLGRIWVYWNKGKKFLKNREKSSSFECGFDPKKKSRLPFSIRFFLLLIFFLIFDIELVLLLQLPFSLEDFFFKVRILYIIFFWVLFVGLLEEWRRGALNWKS